MNRMGLTMEQQARVRFLFSVATWFAGAGVLLSIALVVVGNSGGWLLLALVGAIWTAGFFSLRWIAKSQP